ncbi:MAG: helix-turn-helix domain-containing protein [Desulfopila sp.]
MIEEKQGQETQSLGQLLQKTRLSLGYDIAQIVEETKISSANIKAMEADNYTALPADAFSRGFYTLYARKLALDPEKIVANYRAERGISPKKGQAAVNHNPPAHKAAQEISNMADPSSPISLLSTIGSILLMLIVIAGGFCWYLNINPATYISEKLRSLQTEQPAGQPEPTSDSKSSSSLDPARQGHRLSVLPGGPPSLAKLTQPEPSQQTQPPPPQAG